jgi:hypothetical protein
MPAFVFQRAKTRAGPPRRRRSAPATRPARSCGAALGARFGASRRSRKVDTGTSSFRKADGNHLFRRSSAVLAPTDVPDFFAHEFTGLRCRSHACALLAAR